MPVLEKHTCAICLDTIRHACRELGCLHVYCVACIDEWLSEHAAVCPTCRRPAAPGAAAPPRRAPAPRAGVVVESVTYYVTARGRVLQGGGRLTPQEDAFVRDMEAMAQWPLVRRALSVGLALAATLVALHTWTGRQGLVATCVLALYAWLALYARVAPL
jgi:hypothetical protein